MCWMGNKCVWYLHRECRGKCGAVLVVKLRKGSLDMERQNTYTSKIGDTTFIVNNHFTGTKTLADAFEEIILVTFRERFGQQDFPCTV